MSIERSESIQVQENPQRRKFEALFLHNAIQMRLMEQYAKARGHQPDDNESAIEWSGLYSEDFRRLITDKPELLELFEDDTEAVLDQIEGSLYTGTDRLQDERPDNADRELPASEDEAEIDIPIRSARIFIEERFGNGERPIITVESKNIEEVKRGLFPHSTWDPDECSILVGTFATEPYKPEGEDRISLRLSGISSRQISPRATGPDRHFHGVVMINGPVYSNQFEILSASAA
jgi:hypothetical protein